MRVLDWLLSMRGGVCSTSTRLLPASDSVRSFSPSPSLSAEFTLALLFQALANWLRHGLATRGQLWATSRRLAAVADGQAAGAPATRPMAADFEASLACQAARDLGSGGCQRANGYTEPVLHARRREVKAARG